VAILDSVSFLVACVMLCLISVDARPTTTRTTATSNPWVSVWHDWLDGLRMIRDNRTLSLIFVFMAISALGEGAMGALFAPFVIQVLDGGELGYGGLVSAQAVGGLIGSVALAAHPHVMPPRLLLGLGALGLAIVDLMTFNYHVLVPGVVPGLILMAIVGVPIAGLVVGGTTLIQLNTTDAYRGRVTGAITATAACSSLVGALVAGAIGDDLGIVTVLNVQGLGYGLAGLLMLMLLPSSLSADRAPSRVPEEATTR
jgi:Na+/melibiose symporter-like transporter